MGYCGIPERISGPFNQVLFLGCSVSNFNCNLGWGAEQSTLSVNLVEDNCSHPQSNVYSPLDTAIDTILQQDDNVTGGNAFYKNADGSYITNDPTKALHKNMIGELQSQERFRDDENIILPTDFKDYGKICYDSNGTKTYWTGPDPMFIGASGYFNNYGYDILGTPVKFQFYDFTFGGLVSSWKQNGSQGGYRTFEVEIKSFSSLLNGCQLILDKYAGTVCGIIPNTSDNPIHQNIAMPAPYQVDMDASPPVFNFLDHRATIRQGNIPNVFNIYGYLEYLGYRNKVFGNAGVNDEGIRAQYVYDALIALLGPGSESISDSKSPFSPYGAILTRATRENITANEVDVLNRKLRNNNDSGSFINLTHMGLCQSFNVQEPDIYRRCRLKLDISEVPRPPKWLRFQGPVMSIMQFITEICDGFGYDFFIDFQNSSEPNVSGIIKIRTVSRRKQPKKDQISQLILDMANRGGVSSYSRGKEFTDANTRAMYIGGKQKRLLQLKCTRLAFKQNTLIYDPWANNGDGAMINYSANNSLLHPPNTVREPNPLSTRMAPFRFLGGSATASDSYNFNMPDRFADSRKIRRGNYYEPVDLAESKGFMGSFGSIGSNIELFKDTICPYFGTSSDGIVRQVYFDTTLGQMQIVFKTMDIQDLTALPLMSYNPYAAAGSNLTTTSVTPLFLVLENEIRAAGAGFVPWLKYCFGSLFTTDIEQLIYKGFRDKYGFGAFRGVDLSDMRTNDNKAPMFANMQDAFMMGMSAIFLKASQKTIIVNGRPMQVSLDDLTPQIRSLYNDLEKIHRFFQNIAHEYYGKQYMIRLPELAFYRDLSYTTDNNNNQIILGVDEEGNNIYALEGTGKVYTNYSISTDGAWEEPGNFIDDTIVTGGRRISAISDESGKIPCLLGFNASLEKENSRKWFRQQFLRSAAERRFSDLPRSHTVFDYEFILERKFNDPDLQDANHYYSPLTHTLSPDEYMMMSYLANDVQIYDAHGNVVINDHKYKLYAKATPSADFQFLETNYGSPRAIVALSSPIFMGQEKNGADYHIESVMAQDGLCRIFRGASVPTFLQETIVGSISLFSGGSTTLLGGLAPNPMGGEYLNFSDFVSVQRNIQLLHSNIPPDSAIINKSTDGILGRAAIPLFCALPIEYNQYVYGPWINHPGLIADIIFPDTLYEENPESIQKLEIENLIGGVKVNVDESLVPWNFGGMDALDTAIMLKIADDVNYQQTLEMGTVQVPGFDNLKLGDMIKYYGDIFDGPIINSVQVQIGEGGITTTYNFRTYLRKLGLFNKENSDRIKSINQESIKRNKEINTKLLQLSSKINTFRIFN